MPEVDSCHHWIGIWLDLVQNLNVEVAAAKVIGGGDGLTTSCFFFPFTLFSSTRRSATASQLQLVSNI